MKQVPGAVPCADFSCCCAEDASVLDAVHTFLEENYQTDITLKGLTERFYLSKTVLCRKFRARYGITVIRFLSFLRLREAERLLQSDELSVTSIAARSGFHSVQYFSKHFKWDVGLTPTAYREKSARLHQKR